VNEGQALDGAYPGSLGRSGPAGIFEINNLHEELARGKKPDSLEDLQNLAEECGGRFKTVEPYQASQPVTGDDVIINVNAGGGGVGDPLDREPERVLADVERRIFSLEMAREVFGVVIDPETRTVNEKATKAQRAKIRERRRKRGRIWGGDN
jgi:N-methylhydantoinase B